MQGQPRPRVRGCPGSRSALISRCRAIGGGRPNSKEEAAACLQVRTLGGHYLWLSQKKGVSSRDEREGPARWRGDGSRPEPRLARERLPLRTCQPARSSFPAGVAPGALPPERLRSGHIARHRQCRESASSPPVASPNSASSTSHPPHTRQGTPTVSVSTTAATSGLPRTSRPSSRPRGSSPTPCAPLPTAPTPPSTASLPSSW